MRFRASSSSSCLEVRLLIASSLPLISESRGGGGGCVTLGADIDPVAVDWDAESMVDDFVREESCDLDLDENIMKKK